MPMLARLPLFSSRDHINENENSEATAPISTTHTLQVQQNHLRSFGRMGQSLTQRGQGERCIGAEHHTVITGQELPTAGSGSR